MPTTPLYTDAHNAAEHAIQRNRDKYPRAHRSVLLSATIRLAKHVVHDLFLYQHAIVKHD
jgi:hypothetical protein